MFNKLGDNNSARIGTMVKDIIYSTLENSGGELTMSRDIMLAISDLRNFLYENVYETNRVHEDFIKAMKVVRELYNYFLENGLPKDQESGEYKVPGDHRQVCDFVAGMTDRYALDLYRKIFLPKPWPVM
ncbi:MAG: hypothetical protein JRJ51_21505 [Deltaproteobacteria bacterium]|nr:hypothetical protein [Deltaproteobacteria bacterium]